MKIHELHIRNIGSIEKADIDFDNDKGLIDPDTGLPAQCFLIYGDTGSGKSILLDAISMALFKNTPRIEGTNGKKNNSFTDKSGTEINIFSIEQYRRLGISETDESYSEVYFSDKDGNRYGAKLELGNKSTTWKFFEPGMGWTKADPKKIEDIIGINFDQFNRMAMLAQGEFAEFLCGDRSKRSNILEKLTNTTNFTKYGEAIRKICSAKETDCKTAFSSMETAESFVLKPDDLLKLKQDKKDNEDIIRETDSQILQLTDRIAHLDKIIEAQSNIDKTSPILKSLTETSKSDEYLSRKRLYSDWDATDKERQDLESRNQASERLKIAESSLLQLKRRFSSLSLDLSNMERIYGEDDRDLVREENRLKELSHLDSLYSDAGSVCTKLATFQSYSAKLSSLYTELDNAKQQEPTLASQLDAAKKANDTAAAEVGRIQKEIDTLTGELNALNPSLLDEQFQQLNTQSGTLNNLKTNYSEWKSCNSSIETTKGEIAKLNTKRTEADNRQKEAAKDNEEKQEALTKARELFATHNASLDEKLCELRAKLASGYADICPLCGQKISDALLTREEFASIVSPFEEQQKKAKEEADNALLELENANKDLASIDGQIGEKNRLLTSLQSDAGKRWAAILKQLEVLSINPNSDIDAEIAAKEQSLKSDLNKVNQEKQKVNGKQGEIQKKQEEKTGAVKRQGTANTDFLTADNNNKNNSDKISNLNERISKDEQELGTKHQELSALIEDWWSTTAPSDLEDPSWQANIELVKGTLSSLAAAYMKDKEKARNDRQQLNTRKGNITDMSAVRSQLLEQHSDWKSSGDGSYSPRPSCTLQEWHSLESECSITKSSIESHKNTISECNLRLAQWYSSSGHDEQYLADLIAKRDSVAGAREFVTGIDSQITTKTELLHQYDETIKSARTALGLEPDMPLPDRNEMANNLNEATQKNQNARNDLGGITSSLSKNEENNAKLTAAKNVYEKTKKDSDHWKILNSHFGGERFKNLVQTHILRPLLNNANIYLQQITDRYTLTCSEENLQLSILVLDRYNRDEVRSATVLSGGERFMISLALSLALSSLKDPRLNVNILFIDEGFGTLDQECLDSVMKTLTRLSEMPGQKSRRVGIITHRDELLELIPNKIKLIKSHGCSQVEIVCEQ